MKIEKIGNYFESDLEEIYQLSKDEVTSLKNEQITILGGSGFIGSWVTTFILFLNKNYKTNINILIPTRNKKTALDNLNVGPDNNIEVLEFNFLINDDFNFDKSKYIIVGATPTIKATGSNQLSSLDLLSLNIVNSLNKYFENNFNSTNIVHLSSGAVYKNLGNQILESDSLELNQNLNPYAKNKLFIENSLKDLKNKYDNLKISNPRLFAFFGPGLALNEHFAIGNFLRDGFYSKDIIMQGNYKTVRSYLYTNDLISWIVKLLVNPINDNLNFGSDIPIEMGHLSKKISEQFNNKKIIMQGNHLKPSCYYPSIQNTKEKLKVVQTIDLDEGLKRWIKWIKTNSNL